MKIPKVAIIIVFELFLNIENYAFEISTKKVATSMFEGSEQLVFVYIFYVGGLFKRFYDH